MAEADFVGEEELMTVEQINAILIAVIVVGIIAFGSLIWLWNKDSRKK
jgi:hypothetical protein